MPTIITGKRLHNGWFMKRDLTERAIPFFFQAEDGIRDLTVTGVQTCALPIYGDNICAPRGKSFWLPLGCRETDDTAPASSRACAQSNRPVSIFAGFRDNRGVLPRSEEHTSELQSQSNLVCRLLLEKKKRSLSA